MFIPLAAYAFLIRGDATAESGYRFQDKAFDSTPRVNNGYQSVHTTLDHLYRSAAHWTDSFYASFLCHLVKVSDFVEGFVIDVVHPDLGPRKGVHENRI